MGLSGISAPSMEQLTLCGGRLRFTEAKEQVLHLKCKIRRGALGEHEKKTMRNVRPDRPHEPGTVACAGPLAVLQAAVRGIPGSKAQASR